MNGNKVDFDTKIKNKFKLFSGARSQEEDQKIFDKVYDLCFDDTVKFLCENLNETDRTQLPEELKKQTSEEDKNKILLNYMSKIDLFQLKLNQRLDSFLDNLSLSSLSQAGS